MASPASNWPTISAWMIESKGTVGIQYHIEAEPLGGSITPRLDWFPTGNIAVSPSSNTFSRPAYSLFNGCRVENSSDPVPLLVAHPVMVDLQAAV